MGASLVVILRRTLTFRNPKMADQNTELPIGVDFSRAQIKYWKGYELPWTITVTPRGSIVEITFPDIKLALYYRMQDNLSVDWDHMWNKHYEIIDE